ncbi:MAG: hypothetical protein LKE41_00850 [Prevotella sp.]|jgi:phage repressor protein C with HTH and peptisase S24 domain|nr:hypothetical protein [Prevotella sp.]
MEHSVKQRIMQFITENGLSVRAFERSAGLSVGYIKSLRHQPSEDKLSSILKAFPQLNRTWLLTGEGNMLGSTTKQKSQSGIPLIPIDAMAGHLTGDDFQIRDYECERYVIPDFASADFLVTVSGDSMQPTLMSGDILAVKKVEVSKLWFQWGKPYVIATRQGCIVKRIMPSKKDGYISIVSDNKEQYPPYDLQGTEINGIAIVVGLIRKL